MSPAEHTGFAVALVAIVWAYGWLTWKLWPLRELRNKSLARVVALGIFIAGLVAYFFVASEWARMLFYFGFMLFISPRFFDKTPRPWNRSRWSVCSIIARVSGLSVLAFALLSRSQSTWLLVAAGITIAVALVSEHMDKKRRLWAA